MKIVIDIDDEVYNFIKNKGHVPYGINIANEIANGTVLPKGHGDLIDKDELSPKIHGVKSIVAVLDAPTIIPADK